MTIGKLHFYELLLETLYIVIIVALLLLLLLLLLLILEESVETVMSKQALSLGFILKLPSGVSTVCVVVTVIATIYIETVGSKLIREG